MRTALRCLCIAAACYLLALVALYWSPSFHVRRHQVEAAGFIFTAFAFALLVASSNQPQRPQRVGDRFAVWSAIAVALAGILLMWRSTTVGYLSDDFVLHAWAMSGQWLGADGRWFARPLVLGLWRVTSDFGGGPGALHTIGLALHGTNTVLSMFVARRMGLAMPGALTAGLVVLLWPTQVEPVLWTAGLFDLLMTTFVLACVSVNPLSDRRPLPLSLLMAVVCATGALLCKEPAIAIPLLWLIVHAPRYRLSSSVHRRQLVMTGAALILLCVVYLVWRDAEGLPLSGVTEITRYVLKEHVSRTAAGLAVPFTVSTVTTHPWIGIVAACTVLAATLALVLPAPDGHGRIGLQGFLWCVAAAGPTIGYLIIGADLDGSRYLYLPSVGLGLFLGAGLERSLQRKWGLVLSPLLLMTVGLAIRERQLVTQQWLDAAVLRDKILAEAVAASHNYDCGEVAALGLPERYKGAQLFRNGFDEAFAAQPRPQRGSTVCRLEWVDDRFIAGPR